MSGQPLVRDATMRLSRYRVRQLGRVPVVATAAVWLVTLAATTAATRAADRDTTADLILHHGKIATVDAEFHVMEGIAVADGRIVRVGTNAEVLELRGDQTEVIDLEGRFVIPGLIDSHTHPTGASMFEFDHPVPEMETIAQVLEYVKGRTEQVPAGSWIWVNQIFITRLREQRYPTRAELDAVAPKHPVVFSTGPDAAVNSLALELSGIGRDFQATGAGYLEKDPASGELTGILRGGTKRYLKSKSSERPATPDQQAQRLVELFRDYNATGITSIADRNASEGALQLYQRLRHSGELSVRIAISHAVDGGAKISDVRERIAEIAKHPLRAPDPWLRIVGIKTFQDGGMLTGSAYMRQPWGISEIYGIRDPAYQGVLFIPKDQLRDIVQCCVENGLQFTAHSVGDGAVYNLVDVYEEVDKSTPVRPTRPCITHCNFMGPEAISRMARLGVVADIQPAWLYLDARTLQNQFGYERLRYFQPLKTMFAAGAIAGGGSDHMQKIGSLRSINFYHPFLAMWTAITRQAKWYEGQLHPEEALTREQAIRFYTANNAYLLFWDQNVGSLETGKLADLVVLDRDLLTCPVDDIRETRVERTYVAGKLVHPRPHP